MIELKGTYNQDCKIFIDEVETEAIELVRNILNQEISAGSTSTNHAGYPRG